MVRQVSCPACRTNFRVSSDKPVKVKCTKCGKVFAVGAAPSPGVQADKKPPAVSANRKSPAPTPGKKSSGGCLVLAAMAVLGLIGLGAAGAVGAYFLFIHKGRETAPLAQNDAKDVTAPGSKEKPPEPKEQQPKEKVPPPPKDKMLEPKETSKPKEKTPEPKDKTPEPKDKTPEPKDKTPEPKEKPPIVEPMPKKEPVAAGLYTLKNPPTPPDEITLDASSSQIVVTPDGKTAVVGVLGIGAERRVLVVDLTTGKTIKNTPMPGLAVRSMVLTPDGKVALIGGYDDRPGLEPPQRIYLWTFNVKTGTFTAMVKGPTQEVVALSITPDASLLACQESGSGQPRGVVRVINRKTGATIFYKEKVHQNLSRGIAITPDKKYVISTGVENDGKCKVVVFDLAAKKEVYTIANFPGMAEGLAVSSDSTLLAAAVNQGIGGSVRVWDIETGAEKLVLIGKGSNKGARRIAFGPDDNTIIATFYNATTRVFDLKTGNEEGGFYSMGVNSDLLTVTPDGKTVVTVNSKDLRVWQLPDSLMRLTKADQPAFVDIILDGKSIVAKAPAGNTEVIPDHVAVIEAIQGKMDLVVTIKGSTSRVTLKPETKFFDAAGKPVAADEAPRIYRLGNQVTLTMHKFFNGAVAQMRLVKEGPAEITVENAKQTGSGFPIFIFALPGKELRAKLSPEVRYVDHEGKAISAKDGKFFNSEDIYALKLRLEVGEEAPILIEARLTPEKGQLPVFLKYPLGVAGAKTIKNAEIKHLPFEKGTNPHLVVADEQPMPFFMNKETKIYDMKGNAVNTQQFLAQKDMRVDAVIVPRGKGVLLLEMKALVPLAAPPPVAKKTIEYKDATITRPSGNDKQAVLKPAKGRGILVSLDPNLQAFDKEGKAIAADRIYKEGARVDAKVEEAGADRTLIEARLVDEPVAAGKRNFEGVEVLKEGKNVYIVKIENKNINAFVFKETKFFDADGKATTVDQVLRAGSRVDMVINISANLNAPSLLLEARPSKKK